MLRGREEIGYTSGEELRQWLTEANVDWHERLLEFGLTHLLDVGRLQ